MSSDIRRAKGISAAERADARKPSQIPQKDALFEHDWEELVIRFDPSRHCFEVKTAGGSPRPPVNQNYREIAASDGKK